MKNKGNRIITVIAAIAIQLCLGISYIWSIFQTGIAKSIFNGDNAAAGLSFSLLLATLSVGSTIGGKLQDKYGPRTIVIIGGLILGLGFFGASFVTPAIPWLLWLTYGVIGGLGMGFIYSTTISCVQKWYPDKKGLITGVILAAIGFGGVIFAPLIEFLIESFGGTGVGELKSFMVLGILFTVVCTTGGIFIKNPPKDYVVEGYTIKQDDINNVDNNYTPTQILKMPQFYLLVIAFMLACMGGLMMIGFAKPIAVAKGMASTATIGVMIVAIFNSFGRFFWGWVSDKLGRKKTIILLLCATAILSLFVNVATGYLIYVIIGLIGFCYGGFLSIFPSFTSDLFGMKYMATNYGMVLVGFGLGAVASSFIAGHYKNIAGNDINLMFPAFVIASVGAVVGIVLILIIKKPKLISN